MLFNLVVVVVVVVGSLRWRQERDGLDGSLASGGVGSFLWWVEGLGLWGPCYVWRHTHIRIQKCNLCRSDVSTLPNPSLDCLLRHLIVPTGPSTEIACECEGWPREVRQVVNPLQTPAHTAFWMKTCFGGDLRTSAMWEEQTFLSKANLSLKNMVALRQQYQPPQVNPRLTLRSNRGCSFSSSIAGSVHPTGIRIRIQST